MDTGLGNEVVEAGVKLRARLTILGKRSSREEVEFTNKHGEGLRREQPSKGLQAERGIQKTMMVDGHQAWTGGCKIWTSSNRWGAVQLSSFSLHIMSPCRVPL